jgi:hypothetical protein
MTEKLNLNEIRVFAAQRSGHHGVISWLTGHFKGEVLHVNDASGARDHYVYNANADVARDCYVVNVENADLRTADAELDRDVWKLDAGWSERIHRVLVLRSPYNCLASHISMFGHCGLEEKIALWRQYALEFSGRTSFLPASTVKVPYDLWFSSIDARRKISRELGLEFSDRNLGVHGNATPYRSRFDPDVKDARRMAVLDRWRGFLDDPVYVALFDQETHALAAEIFGEAAAITGAEIWRRQARRITISPEGERCP